jgi:glycosyltransferase involved in cell wall biosynthesis
MNKENIHIINLSIDAKLFDDDSKVSKRFIEYANLFGRFDAIVYTRQGLGQKELAVNATAYPSNSSSRISYFFNAYKIFKDIMSQNVSKRDIIISSQDAFTHLLAIFLKKKFKIKIQLQYHTDFMTPAFRNESIKNYFRYLAYKYSIKKADLIRVVSEKVKISIQHLSKGKKITVLPIYLDCDKFQNSNEEHLNYLRDLYPQYRVIILMMSRFSIEKNIKGAILIFRKLVNLYNDIGLVLVGSGEEFENLKNLVNNENLQQNVNFLPWQNDVLKIYKSADIFLNTSSYEGYGLSIIEAGLSSLPIVTSDVGIVSQYFKDGESAYICPVFDEKRFLDNLSNLVSDSSLRKKKGGEARRVLMNTLPTKEEYLNNFVESFSL